MNGVQDTYSTARRKLFYFDWKHIAMLPSWKLEYNFLAGVLMDETRSPSVIADIIIGYSGTRHSDALMAIDRLGDESDIGQHIHGIHQTRKSRSNRSAIQFLDSIANVIKYPRLSNIGTQPILRESKLAVSASVLDKIIVLAKQISTYDEWEPHSAGQKIVNIFYQIILLGWSPWILNEY